MSQESHTVHLDLTADEVAELIELYEKQVAFHQGYINRAKNNVFENIVKRDRVIENHEKRIQFYENLMCELRCQSW